MKIDFNTLNKNTNLGILRPEAMLHYARKLVDYLQTHNKNTTRKQDEAIYELSEIINAIKIEK